MTDEPHTPSLLDAARAYAARGWPVFPLVPRDKRPLTQHGVKDATTDPAQLERWWRAHPAANIGLDCGGAGLVVIDIDAHGSEKCKVQSDECKVTACHSSRTAIC